MAKLSALKAFRRWHKKHPDCEAVFMRRTDVEGVFPEPEPQQGFQSLSLDGVAIVPVGDDELPVRFLAVFHGWDKLIRDAAKGKRVWLAHAAFVEQFPPEQRIRQP